MKRFIFTVILFISFISFSISVEQESIFEWGDFNVVIEIGEDLQVVLSKVKSQIKLKQGYEDPNFYVENNYINFTTQSTINTNIVGKHRLDHRAVSPKYKKSEVRSYNFHIVDVTAPIVISSNKFFMAYGASKPNFLSGIIVIDNITPKEEIEILIDETNIIYSKIGIYPILYTFKDKAGNTTLYIEYLEIVDLIQPTITQIKPLIHQVGEEFIFDEYFLTSDNYDENLTIKYSFSEDINSLGIKTINVIVKDQSDNTKIFTGEIEIVDNIAPVIDLNIKNITLEIEEELDFLEFVEVSDNYDELTKDDLIITNNINYQIIGSYEVMYELIDSSNNKTTAILNVFIKDQIPPTITANDIKINKNQEIDFLLNVKVEDNYSNQANISLKIVFNDVNNKIPGIYHLTYEAVDESGNHVHKTITVTVTGSTNEQKSFYLFLALGITVIIIGAIIVVIKRRKKNLYDLKNIKKDN